MLIKTLLFSLFKNALGVNVVVVVVVVVKLGAVVSAVVFVIPLD